MRRFDYGCMMWGLRGRSSGGVVRSLGQLYVRKGNLSPAVVIARCLNASTFPFSKTLAVIVGEDSGKYQTALSKVRKKVKLM
jgi:hypothetical protein